MLSPATERRSFCTLLATAMVGFVSNSLKRLSFQPASGPDITGSFYTAKGIFFLVSVTVVTFFLLGYGINRGEIASAYSDPISKIRAQDESVYANSSLHMANNGGWLTPKYLGRLMLYKPPLLIWLSALSMKCFGVSLPALRAPALLAGVVATLLLFLWGYRSQSPVTGWTCALLLLANPMWHIFARICYTDMLFVACVAGSLFILHLDAALARPRNQWIFAICCAAGVLTKNIAGFLPLLIWFLVRLLRQDGLRPLVARAATLFSLIFLLVAPWHLYQLAVHTEWFWADYVQMQILGFGLQPPAQSTSEPQLWFYIKRVSILDPVLIGFVLLALPAFWKDLWRRRSENAVLLVVWIAVIMAALMMFRYRNLPYALNLVPPLAMLAALYSPGGWWRIPALCGALAAKTLFASAVFGIPMIATEPIPSAGPLREYADRGRPNDLIIVSPDDAFYSSTLPLPRVRYAFIDRDGVAARYAPHFVYLGITVTVDQFLRFDELSVEFAKRLRTWGLNSREPLATAIIAQSVDDIARLAGTRLHSDFFLPAEMLHALPPGALATHDLVPAPNGRIFLLARDGI